MDEPVERPVGVRWLAGLLAGYALVAVPVALHVSDQINLDGVVYLRLAEYYRHGDLGTAISGYWSPLYSWLLLPWLALGVPGLLATKLLAVLLGLAWVSGIWLLGSRYVRDPWLRALLGLSAGVAGLAWSMQMIAPDLLLAVLLTYYFVLASGPRFLDRPALAFGAGVLGGFAYLAKAYAFPFFLAHFAGTVALRAWAEPGERVLRRAALATASGLLGFALVAGPWVSALSLTYGYPTFSTAAARNRLGMPHEAVVGPLGRWLGTEHRLAPVEPGRLTSWEVPDRVYADSPGAALAVASSRPVAGRLKAVAKNAIAIRNRLASFDYFHLGVPAVLGAALLALVARRDRKESARYLWGVLTVTVYAGGFLPLVAVEDRYFWPIAGLLTILALAFGERVATSLLAGRATREAGPSRSARWVVVAVGLVVAASYLQTGLHELIRLYNTPRPDYVQVAARLDQRAREAGAAAEGPLAGNDWERSIYVAYALRRPMSGTPAADRPDALAAELRQFGIRTYLVFDDPGLSDALQRDRRFRHLATVAYPAASTSAVSAFQVLPES